METLLEVHAFIIRVKRKIALGSRLGKHGKRQNKSFRKLLLYTSLVTHTFSSERPMSLQIFPATECLKKFNHQFFCKVSKVCGALAVRAVKGSYFQGHFKTFVERKKAKTNLSN